MNAFVLLRPALIILELRIKTSDQRVSITARRSGIFAFFLHLLGLGNLYHFDMAPTGFFLQHSSLSGTADTFCPKAHIACCVFLVKKPVEYLGFAAFLCVFSIPYLAALPILAVVLLLLALAVVVFFFLAKERVTIGVLTDAGTTEAIRLRADADEKRRLRKACAVMESIIGAEDRPESAAAEADEEVYEPQEEPAPPPAAEEVMFVGCPYCHKQLRAPATARGRRVSCPSCHKQFQVN